MRTSQHLLHTLKKTTKKDNVISNQLMVRAGMIRKAASGIYIWLPTGLRVLRKIENIVRKEMESLGMMEVSMPIVQPASIWERSNRLKQYGSELITFIDRKSSKFILAPTHEEIMTAFICKEVNSYKQLPLKFFQIRHKFRDELRPRCGVLRSREFLMKDAYSFHTTKESLEGFYSEMWNAYLNIFKKIGLDIQVKQADPGTIGGYVSHEFQTLFKRKIAISKRAVINTNKKKDIKIVSVPGIKNIHEVIKKLHLTSQKALKTILVKAVPGNYSSFVALTIKEGKEFDKNKAENLPIIAKPLEIISNKEIFFSLKITPEFLGPLNLSMPVFADYSVKNIENFISGANLNYTWYVGGNLNKHVKNLSFVDISKNREENVNTIEVAHIFQLGSKYSEKFKALFQDKMGQRKKIIMGCYGIGLDRIVATVIEQNHDEKGIIWPKSIAPFQIGIVPINKNNSPLIKKRVNNLYEQLKKRNIEVILDDRSEQLGVIFADMELIGIPHVVVIGEIYLKTNKIEYRSRKTSKKLLVESEKIESFLINILNDD